MHLVVTLRPSSSLFALVAVSTEEEREKIDRQVKVKSTVKCARKREKERKVRMSSKKVAEKKKRTGWVRLVEAYGCPKYAVAPMVHQSELAFRMLTKVPSSIVFYAHDSFEIVCGIGKVSRVQFSYLSGG